MALDAMAERYEAQGFLTQVDVFSEREIGRFRTSFDALEAREGKEKCQIGLHIAPQTKSPSSLRTRALFFVIAFITSPPLASRPVSTNPV